MTRQQKMKKSPTGFDKTLLSSVKTSGIFFLIFVAFSEKLDFNNNIFCKNSGSRSQRSIMALQNVGPAVLNGGVSTFLAMVLLAASKSYVFTVFFKVSIYFQAETIYKSFNQ